MSDNSIRHAIQEASETGKRHGYFMAAIDCASYASKKLGKDHSAFQAAMELAEHFRLKAKDD